MKKALKYIVFLLIPALMLASCEKETEEEMSPEEFANAYLKAGAYDQYGYNYDAHLFSGTYFNAYAEHAGFNPYQGREEEYLKEGPDAEMHLAWSYREAELLMKWNEAWLSKYDRDEDGQLDRHWGFDSYIGSGAWLTNHQTWWHNGIHYTYFVKITAVDFEDVLANGYWYDAEGQLIGESIWGQFAIVQEVLTPGGVVFHPAQPGL